jgi:hypothetical protein
MSFAAHESSHASAEKHGHLTAVPAALDLAVDGMGKMQRLPIPWHHTWRAAEALGLAKPKSPVIFECVGVPGVLAQVIASAPLFSRVVIVGVCIGTDKIRPAMAINKEIDLRFVLGYTPVEFRDTLHMLAEGKVNPGPLVTGTVGLDGVDGPSRRSEIPRPTRRSWSTRRAPPEIYGPGVATGPRIFREHVDLRGRKPQPPRASQYASADRFVSCSGATLGVEAFCFEHHPDG